MDSILVTDQLPTLTRIQEDHGNLAKSVLVQPQWVLCILICILSRNPTCWASCHRIWSSQTEPEVEFQVLRVSLWRRLDCISAFCRWHRSVSFTDVSINLFKLWLKSFYLVVSATSSKRQTTAPWCWQKSAEVIWSSEFVDSLWMILKHDLLGGDPQSNQTTWQGSSHQAWGKEEIEDRDWIGTGVGSVVENTFNNTWNKCSIVWILLMFYQSSSCVFQAVWAPELSSPASLICCLRNLENLPLDARCTLLAGMTKTKLTNVQWSSSFHLFNYYFCVWLKWNHNPSLSLSLSLSLSHC